LNFFVRLARQTLKSHQCGPHPKNFGDPRSSGKVQGSNPVQGRKVKLTNPCPPYKQYGYPRMRSNRATLLATSQLPSCNPVSKQANRYHIIRKSKR